MCVSLRLRVRVQKLMAFWFFFIATEACCTAKLAVVIASSVVLSNFWASNS